MATSWNFAKESVRLLKMELVDPAPFGYVHTAAEVGRFLCSQLFASVHELLQISTLALLVTVDVRRCSCGLVYYWCKLVPYNGLHRSWCDTLWVHKRLPPRNHLRD